MNEYIKLDLGFMNLYLLKVKDGYIQFDAGYSMKKYLKALDELSIDPKEIKLIVVNHAHGDHVAALKAMKEITNAQVLTQKKEAAYLRKGISSGVKPLTLTTKILFNFLPKYVKTFDPVEPDIIIDKEYSLQDYGIDAKVIHTPGHTPGTLSILTGNGNAFIGCSTHGFPLRLRSGLPSVATDIEKVKSSWELLLSEGAKQIHGSHGKAVSIKRMKKILKKRKKALGSKTIS